MAPADTDRNLLFGLLALQNGLIDQARLVGAFQAWTLEKGRPLAEHLVAMGHLTPTTGPPSRRCGHAPEEHGGSTERSLAAVAAGPSTRASLDAIAMATPRSSTLCPMSALFRWRRPPHRQLRRRRRDLRRAAIPRPPPPRQGRPGAVFVALDEELHREVGAQADPRQARR